MAESAGELLAKVDTRIDDKVGHLTPDKRRDALSSAIGQYSRRNPLEKAVEVTGDGGFEYVLYGSSTIAPGFTDGLSSALSIVYPYDSTDQKLEGIPENEWEVLRLAAGLTLRFLAATPSSSEAFLLTYSSIHTVNDSGSTIPDVDDEAVADLVAAECCLYLASKYGQETNATIGADSVNYLSKAGEYRRQAEEFRKSYESKMTGGVGIAAAGVVGATFSRFQTGERRLFHGRR